MENSLAENIGMILFLIGIAAFTNWLAWKNHFYTLQHPASPQKSTFTFINVFVVFVIYLGTTMLGAPLLLSIARVFGMSGPPYTLSAATWAQLITLSCTLFFLLLYCKSLYPDDIKRMWKDKSLPNSQPISYDIAFGAMSWAVGFPIVAAVGQLADVLLFLFFGLQQYEQVAVRYLKMSLSSAHMLTIALITITIAAPIIEELIFRGFLQTWLKKHLSVKKAIIVASICFAIFHLSGSQGLGNISLGLSLFTFSCFLGFVYERQGSLFASMSLHATFNLISTLRIIFGPET